MTLSVSTQVNPIADKLVVQTDAKADPNNNVLGTTAKVFMVNVDNSANPGVAAFVKLYDDPAPIVGTTLPVMVFMCPGSLNRTLAIPEGVEIPGMSMACTTSGGTEGNQSLANPVVVQILATAIPS